MKRTIKVRQIDVETGEEIETEEEIEIYQPTKEEILNQNINEAKAYLASTDWYVTRLSETGVVIPEEVTLKRIECRIIISEGLSNGNS